MAALAFFVRDETRIEAHFVRLQFLAIFPNR